ncbi:MAG: DUF2497 domain-containing protein [Hyphomicrobiales bacterium]|nr:DUF2497 domain-containing protein [Hyphomicrobiales bacterium]
MSVVTPDSGNREGETLRRAQRADELSMEEILASIRNIITDDRDRLKLAAASGAAQRSVPASPGPQIVYSNDAPLAPPQDREVARTFLSAAQQAAAWRQAGPADLPEEPEATQDEPLMSAEASSAAASAFEALSNVAAARAAEIANQAVREMLRPMLKTWLDANLPGIVERIIRSEIERIRRGAR